MKSLNTLYIARLDHLRFWAALLVVYHHFRGNLSLDNINWANPVLGSIDYFLKTWLINGSSGVSLFLFLTGFLFCIISDNGKKQINYKRFIYNRILRIFPLMLLIVFIVICVNRQHSDPMDILRVFTLQLNTGHSYSGWGHQYFPSGPIWTIGVEFQFYLLFPFLSLFLFRYGLKYLIGLVILMIGIKFNIVHLVKQPMYWNFYHTIIGRLEQFVIGMIFAVLYSKEYFSLLSKKSIAIVSVLISMIALMWLFTFKKTDSIYLYFSFTIEAICWGIIAIAYLCIQLPESKLLSNILSKLGEISFSIYILHLPIGDMVTKLLSLQRPELVTESIFYTSIRFLLVIVVAFGSFYLVERPFMQLRVKYIE